MWEDPANQEGGKWVVTINQEHEDHQRVMKMWYALVVAVLCVQLEYATDMVREREREREREERER